MLYIFVIFGVIFILFVTLTGKYDFFMRNYFDKQLCKESVRTHSRLHIGGIEAFSDVKCPIEDKEIQKDSDINSELAYHLAECWDKYGEGRLKLFSNEWISTEKFCAVCKRLTFRDKEIIDSKEFIQYLQETPAPKEFSSDVFDKQTVSYYTYLTGYQTEELDLSKIPLGEYSIDTNGPYAVVFTYTKKGDLISEYTANIVGFGAIVGAISSTATIGSIRGIPFIGKAILGGKTILALGIAGTVGGAYAAAKIGGVPQQVDSAVALIPYNEEDLLRLDCNIFPVVSE